MGTYVDANGDRHGFLLNKKGVYTTLDVPVADALTVAEGINNAGQIVGLYADAGGTNHGFILSEGVYTTLDVPGSKWTEIYSIDAHGQVVGAFEDAHGVVHGLLGTPAH